MYQIATDPSAGLQSSPVTFPILAVALFLSAYILWRRYRSRKRLMQRVAELETLSSAGRAIVAAELNMRTLSELVAVQAGEIIDTDSFHIGLFSEGQYELFYWTVQGVPQQPSEPSILDDNQGAISTIRDSGQPILVHNYSDVSAESEFLPDFFGIESPRSALLLPLISGAKVIGTMGAFSDQPNQFGERELGQMTILANQAAAAFANARIFHREQTRAAQLELVSHIAGQITAISDLDELLTQVVTLTQETFGFNSVNIFGIDPVSGEYYNQASSLDYLQPGTVRLASGLGLIGTAVASGETVLSSNTLDDPRFIGESISELTRSEIVIPLLVDNELMGVLDVQSERTAAFSTQDQSVLEALGAQIAVAILKARQFASQREQAWLATAQLQVAKAIGQSADIDALANSVVRLISMLLGVDHAVIMSWQPESESFHILSAYGLGDELSDSVPAVSIQTGDWPALDAARVGRDIYITQQGSPDFLSLEMAHTESRNRATGQWLVPLIAKEQLLGMLALGLGDHKISQGARREFLRNIASQTAQGLESLKLQLALEEEAWVNTALLQVAEAVNRLTDLDEILDSIVRLVPMLVGVKNCVVLVRDEDRQLYLAGPSHGIDEMSYGLLQSFEIDLSEFPLIERQDVERVGPDAAYYTFRLPEWMETVMNAGTANIVPLRARGRLVGVLVVGPTRNGNPISDRRLNILTGIAQQAAVAVVNDQLYQESAERTRIEQELNVALSIQSSLIPSQNPEIPGCTVSGFWQAARQVSGDFYDYMKFQDGSWGIAIADVADKGIPAALFMALSRTILRTVAFNRRNPSEVLRRANRIIYDDTTSDHFVTVFYALWDPNEGILRYANGGHNPPIHLSAAGETRLLSSDGIALGVLRDISISEKTVRLEEGDCVIFYTDGVTEAMNEDYDEFGLERLIMAAREARGFSADEIISKITQAVEDHAGSRPQFDDTTIVVLKS